MLRFFTAGESHGQSLIAFLEGIPAGLPVDLREVDAELALRQKGYGRSNRQKIEQDRAEVLSGIRHGITSGAPIAIKINNRDYWQQVMSVEPIDLDVLENASEIQKKEIVQFRPGHADLSGTIKYRQRDLRDVLERASARETAARVAVGAICLELLKSVDIHLVAHVSQIGQAKSQAASDTLSLSEIEILSKQSELFCLDEKAVAQMKEEIQQAWQTGDTLGGVIEILAEGVPVGLGSYTQWDRKLDGRLAQAVMSVQAIKAVEVGDGVMAASALGSKIHDALYPASLSAQLPFARLTNHAGGVEGGMTNGARLVVRAYMKPLPTLRDGLDSLSFPDFAPSKAHYERSDVCAAPACAIVAKAMVAFVLAEALLEKFGGDNFTDLKAAIARQRNYCAKLGKDKVSSPADD